MIAVETDKIFRGPYTHATVRMSDRSIAGTVRLDDSTGGSIYFPTLAAFGEFLLDANELHKLLKQEIG